MRILGKNVYIGNKCLCIEYTSRITGNYGDTKVGKKSHKSNIIEKNVLFIKDKEGYFVDIRDTEGLGAIAIKMFGAAPRWKTSPHDAGDEYVEVKPYFPLCDQDIKFDLKELLEMSKSPKIITESGIELVD